MTYACRVLVAAFTSIWQFLLCCCSHAGPHTKMAKSSCWQPPKQARLAGPAWPAGQSDSPSDNRANRAADQLARPCRSASPTDAIRAQARRRGLVHRPTCASARPRRRGTRRHPARRWGGPPRQRFLTIDGRAMTRLAWNLIARLPDVREPTQRRLVVFPIVFTKYVADPKGWRRQTDRHGHLARTLMQRMILLLPM